MRVNIVQNTKEWHEFRKGKIGASQVAAICGIDPFKSRLDVYNDIMGLSAPFENEAMRKGKQYESEAVAKLEEKTGKMFYSPVFQHDDHPWLICSLDAVDPENTEIREIKCPGLASFHQMIERGCPAHYFYQIQAQMFVSGIKKAYFNPYLVEERKLHEEEIRSDAAIQKKIFEQVRDFYEQHILAGIPPESPKREAVFVEDVDFIKINNDYAYAKEQENHWKKLAEEQREYALQFFSGDPIQGNRILIKNVERKGGLDESQMLKDGIDVNKYRKPSSFSPTITLLKS